MSIWKWLQLSTPTIIIYLNGEFALVSLPNKLTCLSPSVNKWIYSPHESSIQRLNTTSNNNNKRTKAPTIATKMIKIMSIFSRSLFLSTTWNNWLGFKKNKISLCTDTTAIVNIALYQLIQTIFFFPLLCSLLFFAQ